MDESRSRGLRLTLVGVFVAALVGGIAALAITSSGSDDSGAVELAATTTPDPPSTSDPSVTPDPAGTPDPGTPDPPGTPDSPVDGDETATTPTASPSADPLTGVPTLDGGLVDLIGPSRRPAVIMFVGSWCAPCRQPLEELAARQPDLDNRVRVVIALVKDDDRAAAAELVAESGIDAWAVVLDDNGDLADHFGVLAVPTTLVMDEAGDSTGLAAGDLWSSDEMWDRIDAAGGRSETIGPGRCANDTATFEYPETWATGIGWACAFVAPVEDAGAMVVTGATPAFDLGPDTPDPGPLWIRAYDPTTDGVAAQLADGVAVELPSGVLEPGASADEIDAARGEIVDSATTFERTIVVRESVVGPDGWREVASGERVLEWMVTFADRSDRAVSVVLAPADTPVPADAADVAWTIAETVQPVG